MRVSIPAREVNPLDMADREIIGTVTVRITADHGLEIRSDGAVAPQELFMAAAFLTRTANQMLDAVAMSRAMSNDPKGLEVVRAMPDNLRAGNGVS